MKMLLTPTFAALIVLLTLITRVNCADSTRPSRDTRETEPVQATSRETGDAEPGRASSRETRDAESLRRDTRDTDVVRAKVYFAIAVSAAGQAYTRAFNKTLINMTQSHLAGELTNYYNYKKVTYNISLETLVIELPENGSFSAALLERLCGTFEGKHVVAVLVVGSSPAAFTVSLAAQHAGIPVLWARGQSEFVPGFRSLILHETGQKETYGSLLKKCIQTAIELKSRNINKGDIVVISPENDLHSCVPMIASMFIGAIPFMTYPKFKAELVEILKLNPKILFSEKETADTVLKSSQENGELTTEIFVFGSNFEEIFLQPRESEDVFLPITTEDLFQTCMMVSSSGTASGISKPVCMKHSSFVKYPEKITGSVVPTAFINHKSWHWVSCIIDFYFCILRGDVMIRSRRFYKILPPDYDVNILWEMVEKYKISSISVLPTLVKPLFGSKNVNHDVSSVRLFITVGSPMLEGYESAIKTILPEVKIINLYGSTEAGAAFTFDFTNEKHRKLHEERPNSVGLPSDGYSIKENSPLEIHLAPTGRELVQALRGLLQHAHWHTFTLLADSASATALRRPEHWAILQAQPLKPTLVELPSPLRAQSLFRKLADISRSTRGVIVLFSDRKSAIRILQEAKRLNMMDGHFVWLWIDTAGTINIGNNTDDTPTSHDRTKRTPHTEDEDPYFDLHKDTFYSDLPAAAGGGDGRAKRSVHNHILTKSDISDLHVNYLLKNDQYLLLNRNNFNYVGVESSKLLRDRNRIKAQQRPTTADLDSDNGDNKINNNLISNNNNVNNVSELPPGLLSLKPMHIKIDRHLVKGAVRLLMVTLKLVLSRAPVWMVQSMAARQLSTGCWDDVNRKVHNFSTEFGRELKLACTEALSGRKTIQEIGVDKVDKSLVANFEILNLVPERSLNYNRTETDYYPSTSSAVKWKRVGMVSGHNVRLDTIIWPGGDLAVAAVSTRARTVFRVVTALAPPFVMESALDEDGQCLRGLPCHRVLTSDKDNLTLVFNEMQRLEDEEDENEETPYSDYYSDDEDKFFPLQKFKYRTNCCYGLSMDLLENIAQELEFDFRLYIVADGLFGSRLPAKKGKKNKRDVGKKFLSYRFKEELTKTSRPKPPHTFDPNTKWSGIVGDLVSGAAHMSFAALSVSAARSEVIDFSAPYFFSGVSFLASPQQRSEIPLMAFLLPFSMELWIAILTSLNITAIAVAIYEWLSPFGLNPWGRQRSKNFSMSSALWVMWGLLCGHLVAFKAPKSWPNKFLINVWGGFSVIFVASYTANIAALIAGLFFHNTVSNYHDRSLLSQKVGAPKSSAAEYYVQRANHLLWEHMYRYAVESVEDGVAKLKNGSLDILIADTPILDYYRATDHGCKLQKIGDTINEDTYAIGMAKGFPLKDSISAVIAKYSSNGYMDILQEKWYGGLPCFKLATDIAQPRPLGVAAVTGVFILLGLGMALGLLILFVEHMFFRYTLPALREKPKNSIWRSRNIMFFSQKLYRFINCVELVSPHHAARELVHTLRQGQITSLFQKSIKRKEHEQRRRRKSKAQFFEMIQEIRRQQQEETTQTHLESVTELEGESLSPDDKSSKSRLSPNLIRRTFMRSSPKGDKVKSPTKLFNKQLFSPRGNNKKSRSSTALNVRRFSTDSVFNSQTLKCDYSTMVGRRLSKDASAFLSSSPPDINSRRSSYMDMISSGNKLGGKSPILSIENISDCGSTRSAAEPMRKLSDSESIGKKLATLPRYQESFEKHRYLTPQHSLTLGFGKSDETLMGTSSAEKQVTGAKSFNSIDRTGLESSQQQHSAKTLTAQQAIDKSNLSDDEIARRNKETIGQLQTQLKNKIKPAKVNSNNPEVKNKNAGNPQIRIQVEDADVVEMRHPPLSRRSKTRHQSLGDATLSPQAVEPAKRNKLQEQSRSLDSGNTTVKSRKERSRSRSRHREDDVPPAPPPPNCSPRNSDGKSPLERLSKDELVRLWRSSESELRSHLLKAIRDKEEPSDPP